MPGPLTKALARLAQWKLAGALLAIAQQDIEPGSRGPNTANSTLPPLAVEIDSACFCCCRCLNRYRYFRPMLFHWTSVVKQWKLPPRAIDFRCPAERTAYPAHSPSSSFSSRVNHLAS